MPHVLRDPWTEDEYRHNFRIGQENRMMRHRNDLMLLRIAQGDAYGMAREYVKTKDFPDHVAACLKLERYMAHPTYHTLPAGTYTDDAQMSIGVTEVLLQGEGCNSRDFVDAWFRCFKRDPRDGYSRRFQEILQEATSPSHLIQLVVPDSNKNGAAMRSVPIGVLQDPHDVVNVAGMQAALTHATWGGINSSIAVALMSHYALYDRRGFSSMREWGNLYCPAFEHFREPWVGPVQEASKDGKGLGVGVNTAWAVHTLLTEETTLLGIMQRLLKWGGDTDSVAAIAWGIASCRMTEELPKFFEDDLERLSGSSYGPSFLKDLGKQLMDVYAARK